jgi:hypothetical protein
MVHVEVQHKHKHIVLAAYQAFLPQLLQLLELLHHKKRVVRLLAHQGWYLAIQPLLTSFICTEKNAAACIHFGSPGHGKNQRRPCSSHVFSTGSKGTTKIQKPGNNSKDFGLSLKVVQKHGQLNVFKKT